MFKRDINKSIFSGKPIQSYSFGWKKELLKFLWLILFNKWKFDGCFWKILMKLFLKNFMSLWAAYNCSNSSKNNPDKTFRKMGVPEKYR